MWQVRTVVVKDVPVSVGLLVFIIIITVDHDSDEIACCSTTPLFLLNPY